MKKVLIWLIIIIIAISPLFRGLFFDFEASIFLMIITMLSSIYFFIKLIKKENFIFNKWILIFGFSLILAYFLGFITAANFRGNLEVLIQYFEYFITALILYDYFSNKKLQFSKNIMVPILITGFICSIIGLEALTGSFPILNDTLFGMQIGSTFQYTNTAAIYFVVCTIFSITLTNMIENEIIKSVLVGIGNILIFALLLTGSRGGYLTGLIVIPLFLILQPKGFKIRGLGIFICMILPVLFFIRSFMEDAEIHNYIMATKWLIFSFSLAFLFQITIQKTVRLMEHIKYKSLIKISTFSLIFAAITIGILYLKSRSIAILPQHIVSRIISFNLANGSIIDRLTYAMDALKLISSFWISGLGGGGWISLYHSVQENFYTAREVHNNYLQIFLEAGIMGFLAYVLLVLVTIMNLIKSLIKLEDIKQKIFVSGILCSFLGFSLHSAFDFDLSYPSIALLFWVLIAGGAAIIPESISNINMEIVKSKIISRNKAILISFIILCSIFISSNGVYAVAAYNAQKGEDYLEALNYRSAMIYYEKAYRLDSINPEYTFELAKLYNLFAKNNTSPKHIKAWRELALGASKRSVSLDGYNPAYREVLARTYSDIGIPLKALEQLIKLVEYQPCNNSNYELLAKGYFEAAEYHINNKNEEAAIDLLIACSEIDEIKHVNKTPEIIKYKDKANKFLMGLM